MALFVEMKANDVRPIELKLSASVRLTNSQGFTKKILKSQYLS